MRPYRYRLRYFFPITYVYSKLTRRPTLFCRTLTVRRYHHNDENKLCVKYLQPKFTKNNNECHWFSQTQTIKTTSSSYCYAQQMWQILQNVIAFLTVRVPYAYFVIPGKERTFACTLKTTPNRSCDDCCELMYWAEAVTHGHSVKCAAECRDALTKLAKRRRALNHLHSRLGWGGPRVHERCPKFLFILLKYTMWHIQKVWVDFW